MRNLVHIFKVLGWICWKTRGLGWIKVMPGSFCAVKLLKSISFTIQSLHLKVSLGITHEVTSTKH